MNGVPVWKMLYTLPPGTALTDARAANTAFSTQERLTRWLVHELNSFDNLFFEIQNEPWADNHAMGDFINPYLTDKHSFPNAVEVTSPESVAWQRAIARVIRDEERLYYRYAVARLAAFCNVTCDLGNEHDLNREAPKWADWLGPLVKQWDPYHHLTSAHNRIYRSPGNPWNDMQLIQHWDGGRQKDFFLDQRQQQAAAGRIVPLVNEEYGYEDLWEKKPGERNAESRRRTAWEICMAGAYQTAGETANRGTGFPPDSGGGWVNGRGDETMTMLEGYTHPFDFFTSFDWWQCEPHNELVDAPATAIGRCG